MEGGRPAPMIQVCGGGGGGGGTECIPTFSHDCGSSEFRRRFGETSAESE